MAIKRIGILAGGGPAPGTNGVISAVTIEAIKIGWVPIGFHDGFDWLAERYTDEQHELGIDEVSRVHLDGGVILGTSRTDITRNRQSLENTIAALKKLSIDALVTIGGDDVVRSSSAIERESRGTELTSVGDTSLGRGQQVRDSLNSRPVGRGEGHAAPHFPPSPS